MRGLTGTALTGNRLLGYDAAPSLAATLPGSHVLSATFTIVYPISSTLGGSQAIRPTTAQSSLTGASLTGARLLGGMNGPAPTPVVQGYHLLTANLTVQYFITATLSHGHLLGGTQTVSAGGSSRLPFRGVGARGIRTRGGALLASTYQAPSNFIAVNSPFEVGLNAGHLLVANLVNISPVVITATLGASHTLSPALGLQITTAATGSHVLTAQLAYAPNKSAAVGVSVQPATAVGIRVQAAFGVSVSVQPAFAVGVGVQP